MRLSQRISHGVYGILPLLSPLFLTQAYYLDLGSLLVFVFERLYQDKCI